jgi:glycosyltransferase involved in cell wall biosynthesis
MRRLITRALGRGDEALAYEGNDWLMRTMAHECRRLAVTAVHAYEDCALWQFVEAKRLGKACIYDMPIGYYPAWEHTQAELARKFVDWLPTGGLPSSRYVRPQQKRQEMELADLVLAPSSFVAETVQAFHPNKALALAPYGVDLEFWTAGARNEASEVLRFIYAGQISLRKGIPTLLQAWEKAALRSAELQLVGSWHLSDSKRASLPRVLVMCRRFLQKRSVIIIARRTCSCFPPSSKDLGWCCSKPWHAACLRLPPPPRPAPMC